MMGRPDFSQVPRLVAWETTIACPLACRHCRAEARETPNPNQLTTAEGKSLIIDEIAGMAEEATTPVKPILILSGGEPLMREDIFELASYATERGLKPVASPDDGRLVTPRAVEKLREAGVERVSFSLHYPAAEKNDYFARHEGAFDAAMDAFENLRRGALAFQVNTTVTTHNLADLPEMLDLVRRSGAVAWHVFLLVPTGRGKQMADEAVSPEDYERTLNWLYDVACSQAIEVKPTCAPHYYRIIRQRAREEGKPAAGLEYSAGGPSGLGAHAGTKGCLAGAGFCFVSNVGEVNPCGYLPVSAGNVRVTPLRDIYRNSELFAELRDVSRLEGKCGACEYRNVCGGCRARAFSGTGNYLAEEPFCTYVPSSMAGVAESE